MSASISNMTSPGTGGPIKTKQDLPNIDDLLRRDHFDWAEDVEEETLLSDTSTRVSPSSDISDEHLALLLEPQSFDWAEDAEEEAFSDAPTEVPPSAEITDEFCDVLLQPKSVDCEDDEVGETALDDASDADSASSSTLPPPGINDDTPMIVNGASNAATTGSEEDNYPEFVQTKAEIGQEFAWRNYSMQCDNTIHHFNWLGSPVYEYSWTPPAVSLMYLLSEPKIPRPGDEWRLQSILSRATTYIDPVLLYLDGDRTDLQFTSHELLLFATGRTYKFYTPHGQWADDWREKGDFTTIDDGDIAPYISPNLAVGNGFSGICRIRSRYQWAMARDQRLAASQSFSGNLFRSKMRDRTYKPSPLKYSMVQDDQGSDDPAGEKNDTPDVSEYEVDEEAYDEVPELPVLDSSRKRSPGDSQATSTLKRRQQSYNLRERMKRSLVSAHTGDNDRITDTDAECIVETPSGLIRSSSSYKPPNGTEVECELANGTRKERKIAHFVPELERISEESNRENHESHPLQTDNVSHRSSDGFDPASEFVSTKAADVQFVSVRSRHSPRYRGISNEWKSKWKKRLDVKPWSRVSIKTRTFLNSKRDQQPFSSLSPSFSPSESESEPAILIEQTHTSESKFLQEYVSFPEPTFHSVPDEPNYISRLLDKNPITGDRDKKTSLTSKVTSKARSLCQKVKDGLHPSKDRTNTKRNRILSTVTKDCITGFSAMSPYAACSV